MAPADPSSPPQEPPTVCFTTQDLTLFSAASHDTNPLHVSQEYARATPYGEPVVFGVLGGLAALGHLPEREDQVLHNLSLEFRNPLTVGVPYRLEVSEPMATQALVKLYDAGRLMIKATFIFMPRPAGVDSSMVSAVPGPLEAADRTRDSFIAGDHLSGTYGPSRAELEQVVERWGLSAKGATSVHIAAMMWASFIVGMELPGKRAIFWRLVLDFEPAEGPRQGPLSYDVTIDNFDERFDLLHTTGNLSCGTSPCATARMWAFVRKDSPRSSLQQITDLLPCSEQLKGKVALVIGGSRGLGAAITLALVSQGCSVLMNFRHSRSEAERLVASLAGASGLIELVQGDAADVEWCRAVQRNILDRYGRLDVLVCNASPPIRPLPFVPEKAIQFQQFLLDSVALISLPMSCFLDSLSERSGWNVVVSSAFVKDLPEDWPHYVTAKCAVEGLVQWAALHYPKVHGLLVRPPKLLTDQTNTTLGRQGAMRVEQVAAAVVGQLCHAASSQTVRILEDF